MEKAHTNEEETARYTNKKVILDTGIQISTIIMKENITIQRLNNSKIDM